MMNRRDGQMKELEALEPEVREALGNFKSSVEAWSEAMMSRPREVNVPARSNWGAVTKWALGCAVFVATATGGVYQNHRQEERAKAVAAARAAEQQRELAEQQAKDQSAAELMAKVDSDISQEVPDALEPLASLMNEDDSRGN